MWSCRLGVDACSQHVMTAILVAPIGSSCALTSSEAKNADAQPENARN
jgi:hypothetical protein